MGTFKLGEVGEYIPKQVAENEFLNEKLESDTYGIYYSVLFEGDAETFLMQAKKAPVVGQPEWGMVEKTKSGKSMRFKRVKREEQTSLPTGGSKPATDYEPGTNARWAIGLAYRAYVQVMGNPEGADGNFPFDAVEQHAKELVRMFENIKDNKQSGYDKAKETAKSLSPITSNLATDVTHEYSDADIPFTEEDM